ncbi:MAG: CdaR family protein [Verrucomicrobiota bacterium]
MSLRAFIQHNFWLKLFALLLATLIWFAIHFWIEGGNRQPLNPITNRITREIRLPVRVMARSSDGRIFKVEPEEVAVTVTGESALLTTLTLQNMAAFVDLASMRSARETNQLVKLNSPGGVTVVNISPRAVNVELLPP